jgi:AcrR family transcriptional regulator
MPKHFSEQERTLIRQRLMESGLKRFLEVGIRAMRIDDLCRDVGIAKGSFYSFFASKEDLFFALSNDRDNMHKREMMADLHTAQGNAKHVLGLFFDDVLERLKTDPLVRLVKNTGDLAYIMRHAPANYIAENQKRDRVFTAELAALLDQRFGLHHADAAMLESVMTLAYTLSLQQENLEAMGVFAATVDSLREMFLKRAIEGPVND